MDLRGEVQQSVQAGGYVAVIRSTAVFETESEAQTALDSALGRIISPKPGGAAPAGAATMRGIVKWYNPAKGFGFIVPDEGGDDVFIHASVFQERHAFVLPALAADQDLSGSPVEVLEPDRDDFLCA